MYEVSTSILNAEKGKEAEIILALEKARTDYIHIDVMDGEFVSKNARIIILCKENFEYATRCTFDGERCRNSN